MKFSFSGLPEVDRSTSVISDKETLGGEVSCKRYLNSKTIQGAKMQNRSSVINKLALMLLSIVVLELILIGHQVQPVKGIKKKIYLKKLKKLLPLLALVKPKKKIILLPIPIPMFKNPGNQQHHLRPHQHQNGPPMSFMMMGGESGTVDGPLAPMPMSLLPMSMSASDNNPEPFSMMGFDMGPSPTPSITRPTSAPAASPSISLNASGIQPATMPMAVPSVTMTIQSEPGGSSAIELSTSMMGSSTNNLSAPLVQRPHSNGNKWSAQQQHHAQQSAQFHDNFDEPVDQSGGGEQYYSSPWPSNKWPPASPAKLFRNERLRANQQVPRTASGLPPSQQREYQPSAPPSARQRTIVLMRSQDWRQSSSATPKPSLARYGERPAYPSEQQMIDQALEFEELIPLGPPQMMPVYQTANGQLHLSPPPPSPVPAGTSTQPTWQPKPAEPARASVIEREELQPDRVTGRLLDGVGDQNSEVQTIGNGAASGGRAEFGAPAGGSLQINQDRGSVASQSNNIKLSTSTKAPSRLTSPAIKGKQQQQQQTPKTKTTSGSSY